MRFSDDRPLRVLVFNQISQERDGAAVFAKLAFALKDLRIDHVLLTNYTKYEDFDGIADELPPSSSPGQAKADEDGQERPTTEEMAEIWGRYQPRSKVVAEPSIQSALSTVRNLASQGVGEAKTLITGSLYLVGGALFYLEKQLGRSV